MRFLCPIDFSEASLNALDHAAHMASICQAHLTLMYVFDEDEYLEVAKAAGNETHNLREQAEQKLKNLVKEIQHNDEVPNITQVDYRLRLGDLVESIVGYAAKEATNLIIMGTTGVGSVEEAWLGSNTVKVFKEASCPVLCVPNAATFAPIRHLVYATDYEPNDQAALKKVVGFATEFKARVEVLHIDEYQSTQNDVDYTNYVNHIQSYITYDKLSFQRMKCDDDVAHCLDQYMNQKSADVLALVTHTRNLIQQLLHKSITKNLAYFTDSPMLILKN